VTINREQYLRFIGAARNALCKEGVKGYPLYWFMYVDQSYAGWQDILHKVEEALVSYQGLSLLYLSVKGNLPVPTISPDTRLIVRTVDDSYKSSLIRAAIQLTKQVSAFVVYSSISDIGGHLPLLRAIEGSDKLPTDLLDDVKNYTKIGSNTFVLTSRCLHRYWKDL
jgi:hypothetical protein